MEALMTISDAIIGTIIGIIITAIFNAITQKREKNKIIKLNKLIKKSNITLKQNSTTRKEIMVDLEKNIQSLIKENSEYKIEIKQFRNRGIMRIGELAKIPSDFYFHKNDSIELASFWIDAYLITNFQFQQFVLESKEWNKESSNETKHLNVYYLLDWNGNDFPSGKKNHPVVWVNWLAAAAFCNWRSKKENFEICYPNIDNIQDRFYCNENSSGYRLPNRVEFEKSARGGKKSEYPWGDKIDSSDANFGNDIGLTTYVGRYPPNFKGVYDLCGNVKEWCNDWHGDSNKYKVFKSGSWASDKDELKCNKFSWLLPENTNPDFGFRCVRKT